jgi:hypothetical protein
MACRIGGSMAPVYSINCIGIGLYDLAEHSRQQVAAEQHDAESE